MNVTSGGSALHYLLLAGFCILPGFTACDREPDVPPEITVFDGTIDWDWPLGAWYGGNSFYWWHRPEESSVVDYGDMPSSWSAPRDFANGTFHIRFTVLEQPADSAFYIQFGIWQDLHKEGGYSETVSPRQPIAGGAGSQVEASLGSPSTWWQKRDDAPVDFNRPEDFYRIGLVLWKHEPYCLPMAQGWSNRNACDNPEQEALNFFPMKARVTVVAVAGGHSFSGWQQYPQ